MLVCNLQPIWERKLQNSLDTVCVSVVYCPFILNSSMIVVFSFVSPIKPYGAWNHMEHGTIWRENSQKASPAIVMILYSTNLCKDLFLRMLKCYFFKD